MLSGSGVGACTVCASALVLEAGRRVGGGIRCLIRDAVTGGSGDGTRSTAAALLLRDAPEVLLVAPGMPAIFNAEIPDFASFVELGPLARGGANAVAAASATIAAPAMTTGIRRFRRCSGPMGSVAVVTEVTTESSAGALLGTVPETCTCRSAC